MTRLYWWPHDPVEPTVPVKPVGIRTTPVTSPSLLGGVGGASGIGLASGVGATFGRTMNVVAWILGMILVAVFAIAGVTKVLDLDRLRDHFGYSKRQYQLIGLSEVAGAAGIVVGLVARKWEWIALAAGVGICSLMLGALIAHARVEDDGKKIIPALAVLGVTIVFMVVLSLR